MNNNTSSSCISLTEIGLEFRAFGFIKSIQLNTIFNIQRRELCIQLHWNAHKHVEWIHIARIDIRKFLDFFRFLLLLNSL